jgi:hypothetical protein
LSYLTYRFADALLQQDVDFPAKVGAFVPAMFGRKTSEVQRLQAALLS